MNTLREAAQQALEAWDTRAGIDTASRAFEALRAALAQGQAEPVQEPVREPVAWIHTDLDKPRVKFLEWSEDEPGYRGCWIKTPLYLSPPQRKPLTDQEIWDAVQHGVVGGIGMPSKAIAVARAIERAHGIGEPK